MHSMDNFSQIFLRFSRVVHRDAAGAVETKGGCSRADVGALQLMIDEHYSPPA